MHTSRLFIAIALFCCACAGSQSIEIVEKPIVFDDERRALSLAYMKEHYGIEAEEPGITPRMIVVHWTAIPTLEGSFNAFYESRLPSFRTGISSGGALNVSVPYLIDQDGTIYQLMPDTLMGRHVIGLNHTAIGIENVGNGEDTPLTEAQYEANKKLIRYLTKKYDIDYLIGHHEYQRFKNHPLWLEQDPDYLTEKSDPGDAFMQRLRNDLSSLNFKPLPEEEPQAIRQGIIGQVLWVEGNQMPGIGQSHKSPKPKGIQRKVYVYNVLQRDELEYEAGFFKKPEQPAVKVVNSDSSGHFSVALDTGSYSLLVEEPQGLYANLFDGNGYVQVTKVEKDSVNKVELKIDYKASY